MSSGEIGNKIGGEEKTYGEFSGISEYLGPAVVHINNYGQVQSWNKGAERIFGYKSEEAIGQNYFDLVVPISEIDKVLAAAEIVKKQGFLNDCRVLKLNKDGSMFRGSANITAYRDDDGNLIGSSFVIQDIPPDNAVDQKTLQAEKMAVIGNLASGVAHEINNPLNNILWNVENLKNMVRENKEIEGSLDEIIRDVEYATKITRNLLSYARQNDPQFSEINVGQIIDKALSMLSFNLKDIKVNKKYDDVPTVVGDANQILQVLLNIFTNAIHASPKGMEITVELENKNNYLQIKVTDKGKGISKEKIGKVFDPFFTTKKEGLGTGLGLSISKGIIERHKGFIDVQSDIDIGSTFTIGLPMGETDGEDFSNR